MFENGDRPAVLLTHGLPLPIIYVLTIGLQGGADYWNPSAIFNGLLSSSTVGSIEIMDGQDSNTSSTTAAAVVSRCCGGRRSEEDEDESAAAAAAACSGKSCQSCTAGAIADCVAVCCCPCAVVNFLTLAFLKLPWAVARRCLGRRSRRQQRRLEAPEGRGDMEGISEKMRVEEGISEIALSASGVTVYERNDNFGAEFKVEEVWLEVGHMGFGRVSFTGTPPAQTQGS
ncbi:uncharacterized protein LOC127258445 [Andrographis paniculata]|uniref:uncharacterized protein LOC127258445 n=1 Tax=Andrographis paniculata TaxID=175694 RepID=UPI0021E8B172|nr:uncharacterized protein LOC127258445 [Andrographis paniculata]